MRLIEKIWQLNKSRILKKAVNILDDDTNGNKIVKLYGNTIVTFHDNTFTEYNGMFLNINWDDYFNHHLKLFDYQYDQDFGIVITKPLHCRNKISIKDITYTKCENKTKYINCSEKCWFLHYSNISNLLCDKFQNNSTIKMGVARLENIFNYYDNNIDKLKMTNREYMNFKSAVIDNCYTNLSVYNSKLLK
jgi:hypothetical protein